MAVLTLRLDEQYRGKVPKVSIKNFQNRLLISDVIQKSAEAFHLYAFAY